MPPDAFPIGYLLNGWISKANLPNAPLVLSPLDSFWRLKPARHIPPSLPKALRRNQAVAMSPCLGSFFYASGKRVKDDCALQLTRFDIEQDVAASAILDCGCCIVLLPSSQNHKTFTACRRGYHYFPFAQASPFFSNLLLPLCSLSSLVACILVCWCLQPKVPEGQDVP